MDGIVWGELSLFLSIAVVITLVLARQMPLQLLGRLFSPISRTIGKLFRFKTRAGGRVSHAANMGPSAWATISRASRTKTHTESVLGDDFSHEEKHLKRHGVLFRWVNVVVGYMQVPTELTREVAENYYKLGAEFLNGRVKISVNAQNLYEDEEGAVIAEYFPTENGNLYLLDVMRKTINSNVRKLTVIFSAIMAIVLTVNLVYNTGVGFDVHGWFGMTGPLEAGPISISAADFNQAVFSIVSTLVGAFAMWLIYYVEYVPYQRNNFRELANFITRYLARLNDHYRTAAGQAKSVTVGQETNAAKFAHSARKWHTNVLWIAMRIFFIESFLRSVIYQMQRNSGYYLVFVPILFIVVLSTMNLMLSDVNGFDMPGRLANLGIIFFIPFFTLLFLYVMFLRRSMDSIDEINQDEWIGFDSLLLENVLGEIVGKYAEDVGYWKNRIGGGL